MKTDTQQRYLTFQDYLDGSHSSWLPTAIEDRLQRGEMCLDRLYNDILVDADSHGITVVDDELCDYEASLIRYMGELQQ